MFGKECVHRLSEERRHKTWPRPCSGAGRLLRAVGQREKVSLMPWYAAFFTPLISSPSLNTAEDAFGPEQQSLALITSIPRGPWYSKLEQWLLKESQIFRRCPSPNLPTNLVSLLPQLYPTQLTWHPILWLSESQKSPSHLHPSFPHIIRTSHLHLDCGLQTQIRAGAGSRTQVCRLDWWETIGSSSVCRAHDNMCPTYKDVHIQICKSCASQTKVSASSIQSQRQSFGTSDLEPTGVILLTLTQWVYIQNTLRIEVGERNSPYSGSSLFSWII